jgi:hypothetical protein
VSARVAKDRDQGVAAASAAVAEGKHLPLSELSEVESNLALLRCPGDLAAIDVAAEGAREV